MFTRGTIWILTHGHTTTHVTSEALHAVRGLWHEAPRIALLAHLGMVELEMNKAPPPPRMVVSSWFLLNQAFKGCPQTTPPHMV